MGENLDRVRELEPGIETVGSNRPGSVREELERILASRTFQASERHRNFLRYTVEETLEGRGQLLKEYSIGIEVFGKNESFDPRVDSIVRVEARKLRARITNYYEDEGKSNPLRIEFVKGSYAPVFHEPVLPSAVTA